MMESRAGVMLLFVYVCVSGSVLACVDLHIAVSIITRLGVWISQKAC